MKGAVATAKEGTTAPRKGGGKRKLIMLAVPLLLVDIGAGLWFSGIAPPLLGMGKPAQADKAVAEADPKHPAESARKLVFADLPEIVANLNAGPRRTMFIKLQAKLELARAEDQPALAQAMPRVLDLFQTYLREMRPEELRGAEGTYRLREELLARAAIAVAPVQVLDVLFTGMLIQ